MSAIFFITQITYIWNLSPSRSLVRFLIMNKELTFTISSCLIFFLLLFSYCYWISLGIFFISLLFLSYSFLSFDLMLKVCFVAFSLQYKYTDIFNKKKQFFQSSFHLFFLPLSFVRNLDAYFEFQHLFGFALGVLFTAADILVRSVCLLGW